MSEKKENCRLEKFEHRTSEELGHYVYILIDPRDKKPFYIGKGQGDRVFQHLKDSQDFEREKGIDYKIDRIKDIGEDNIEIVFVRQGIKNEEVALEIESTLIDIFNYLYTDENEGLANKISGSHHTGYSSEVGLMTLEKILEREQSNQLDKIDKNCMIINVNQLYEKDISEEDLYRITHKWWVMAEKWTKGKTMIEYVLCEYKGLIKEVYKVNKWTKARRVKQKKDPKKCSTRFGFYGRVAKEERIKYVGKSVANKKRRGSANPIRYNL